MTGEDQNKDNNFYNRTNFSETISKRLERCNAILNRSSELTPEQKAQKLKERAKTVARQGEKSEDNGAYLEIVEFFLSEEKYALELKHIREVYPIKELTLLPFAPSFVLGIVNLRGQVLSIIDLKELYELSTSGCSENQQTIILSSDNMEFGILTDGIVGVRKIPVNMIQPWISTPEDYMSEHIKGITKERTVVLDGEKILSDKKILFLEKSVARP